MATVLRTTKKPASKPILLSTLQNSLTSLVGQIDGPPDLCSRVTTCIFIVERVSSLIVAPIDNRAQSYSTSIFCVETELCDQ